MEKLSIVITSSNEPKTIGKAIESFTGQKIKENYELIIVAPDKETWKIVDSYSKKDRRIKLFKDQAKGKSSAINLVLPHLKGEIIILSDGDVSVLNNSINEIVKKFRDKKTGCVSGRPVPQNSKKNIFGYWSHLLCNAAHELREKRARKNEFLECSGYLWAFRTKVIRKFPVDVAEDTIVPIMFYLKNYKIKYASEAKVFVKYPDNLKDFLEQKRRAAGSHENIGRYVNPRQIPRMKTFLNELLGSFSLFFFASSLKEFFYTLLLFPFRFYIWVNLFYNTSFRNKRYTDKWRRVESTK